MARPPRDGEGDADDNRTRLGGDDMPINTFTTLDDPSATS